MTPESRELALALHQIGALQFGEFTLKSGLKSPFYIDLRLLISYPEVLERCASVLADLIAGVQYDRLAAIPYAGLPIGTALALKVKRPMIFPRKEQKAYGTGKQIEGLYQAGERVLVIDDLITRGDAKLEAIAPLQAAGLIVSDIAVLLDRQSGGVEALGAAGIKVHAALRLTDMLGALHDAGRLDNTSRQTIEAWLGENT